MHRALLCLLVVTVSTLPALAAEDDPLRLKDPRIKARFDLLSYDTRMGLLRVNEFIKKMEPGDGVFTLKYLEFFHKEPVYKWIRWMGEKDGAGEFIKTFSIPKEKHDQVKFTVGLMHFTEIRRAKDVGKRYKEKGATGLDDDDKAFVLKYAVLFGVD